MLKKLGLIVVGCIALLACISCSIGGNSDDSDNNNNNVTTYRVTYNANLATSGTVPVDVRSYLYGQSTYVKGNSGNLTLSGYKFKG